MSSSRQCQFGNRCFTLFTTLRTCCARHQQCSVPTVHLCQRRLTHYQQSRPSLSSRSYSRPSILLQRRTWRHWTQRLSSAAASSVADSAPAQQLRCGGCGSELQWADLTRPGYVSREKLQQALEAAEREEGGRETQEGVSEDEEDVKAKHMQLTCKRCFSLEHYNTALNVTLGPQDYLHHLAHLRDKRALVLLVVDVVDFPCSLFPELHSLISPSSRVVVVANKVDLLPTGVDGMFRKRLEENILQECRGSSLRDCAVGGVVFTSVKTGEGLEWLTTTILESWGNRGDVYLLGCTNVGKSSLFNHLLQTLCGVLPGQEGGPPTATISHWPGTTLGLLSFPLLSVGKRRRLLARQAREELGEGGRGSLVVPDVTWCGTGERETGSEPAQNRFWLHDTPGAINGAQLINLLTTKELNLALPKKPLGPRTFILHPGQSLLLGGLARLDYLDGPASAYFTVFSASYVPVHVTNVSRADAVWEKNLGTPLLKLPFGDSERLSKFPRLEPRLLSVTGAGWRESAADVVLSSAGWVAITAPHREEVCLMGYTPGGRGIHCRQPSLLPTAVTRRGKRARNPNHRANFTGQ